MEYKNEIKEEKDKKEKEKIDQQLFSNYSKDFSELLSLKDKQFYLFKSFNDFDMENRKKITNIRESMENFDMEFLSKKEQIAGLEGTPIFNLCIYLKKINKAELEWFKSHSKYLNLRACITSSIDRFIVQYQYLRNYYDAIKSLKNDLNNKYKNIELKSIDKYIKEKEKDKIKLIRKQKIKSTDEIEEAFKFEDKLKKINEKYNEGAYPNLCLKEIFFRLKNFIKEEDEIELDDLREKIDSIYEQSKKDEIYEIWNFDAPRIQSEYKFHLLDTNKIPLNDNVDLDQKNSFNLTNEYKDNILKRIQERKQDNIVLDLNVKAGEIQKTKNLINKILGTNFTQETIPGKEVKELIQLLVNYNNIRIFLIEMNNFRIQKYELKKEVFDIVKKSFKKIADYLLKNPDYKLEDMLTALSETYHLKGDTKHFICHEIKEHMLFKIEAFWEKLMLYHLDENLYNNEKVTISREKIKKNNLDKKESDQVGNLIYSAIMNFPAKVNSYGIPQERIEAMIKNIIGEYQESVRDLVQGLISDSFKNMKKIIK